MGVHGVWQPQAEALFDFKVIDRDGPSYMIYKQAVEDHTGTLNPVDGFLHQEAEHFLKRMATCVPSKWKKSYAQICGYIRARLLFAIIRAASICLKGSRVQWRSGLGFEDGACLYK